MERKLHGGGVERPPQKGHQQRKERNGTRAAPYIASSENALDGVLDTDGSDIVN